MSHGHGTTAKFAVPRWLVAVLFLLIVATFCGTIRYAIPNAIGTMIAVNVAIIAVVVFALQGFYKISANPPHIGALTFLGARTGEVVGEGIVFLPLRPLIFNVIPILITKQDHDMEPAEARTPNDNAGVTASISYTFRPSSHHILNYIDTGEGVTAMNILDDVIDEAFRTVVTGTNEEPLTWDKAIGMSDVFLAKIVARILERYPSPTSPAELEEIIRKLRRANGELTLPDLGIVLERMNVTRVRPTNPKLAEAADARAIESQERRSKSINAVTLKKRVRLLMKKFEQGGLELSASDALRALQLEDGTVTQTNEVKLIGPTPEAAVLFQKAIEAAPALVAALRSGKIDIDIAMNGLLKIAQELKKPGETVVLWKGEK